MEIDELERRLSELSTSEIAYKDGMAFDWSIMTSMSKSTDAQCARLASQGLPMPSPACRVA